MRTQRIEDFKLTEKQQTQIGTLLKQCFPIYPDGRTYYKQMPHFRYLVFEKSRLIAHLSVIHRKVSVGNSPVSIFGVSDLCVHEDFQHQKIASNLLKELEALGQKHAIDFIILLADVKKFYKKNGYKVCKNPCRWLMINEHQTLGVAQRKVDDALMAKSLGDKKWKDGVVDFLGYMF